MAFTVRILGRKRGTAMARYLMVAALLASVAACGSDDNKSGSGGGGGNTFGCSFDIGLFKYCGEYVGSRSVCEQSKGTVSDDCPDGYVGYCEFDANVNPKKTYFYGDGATAEAVKSTCPGGTYHLGTGGPPTSDGAGGSSSNGGAAGSGGKSSASGGNSSASGGKSSTGGSSTATGGSPATESDGGAACNELVNSAPAITEETGAMSDAPALGGGTFSSGKYYLTRFVLYTGTTYTTQSRKGTITVSANSDGTGTMESADATKSTAGTYRSIPFSFSYTTDGKTLDFTTTCGPESPELTGSYAASSTQFDLLLTAPDGSNQILWHYEKP